MRPLRQLLKPNWRKLASSAATLAFAHSHPWNVAARSVRPESRPLRHANGLDQEDHLHGEDTGCCWRMKLTAWKVMYHPNTVITHFGGQIMNTLRRSGTQGTAKPQ